MPGFGIWKYPLLDIILDWLSNGNGNGNGNGDRLPRRPNGNGNGNGAPTAPKNFSGELKWRANGMPYNHLKWETPEEDGGHPIDYYMVYRATGEEEYVHYAKTPGWVRDFDDSNLKSEGVIHYYYMTCKGEGGESEATEVVELQL